MVLALARDAASTLQEDEQGGGRYQRGVDVLKRLDGHQGRRSGCVSSVRGIWGGVWTRETADLKVPYLEDPAVIPLRPELHEAGGGALASTRGETTGVHCFSTKRGRGRPSSGGVLCSVGGQSLDLEMEGGGDLSEDGGDTVREFLA